MKTYLVTGGAGFIGSNFVQYMLQKYQDVRILNLDKLTYAGNLENLASVKDDPRYTFIHADICDKAAVEKIFAENDVDYVVNFAAESHVDRSIREPEVFVKTNVEGTVCLLNAARNAWNLGGDAYKEGCKYLQVSTDEVYGSLGAEGFFTETTPLCPHSPYSASKAAADMLVQAYFDTFRFPVNITRCSNNYGPYQFPEKREHATATTYLVTGDCTDICVLQFVLSAKAWHNTRNLPLRILVPTALTDTFDAPGHPADTLGAAALYLMEAAGAELYGDVV